MSRKILYQTNKQYTRYETNPSFEKYALFFPDDLLRCSTVNIEYWFTTKPPRQSNFNEKSQSVISTNDKTIVSPVYPSFKYILS